MLGRPLALAAGARGRSAAGARHAPSHYAPRATLRLDAADVRAGEALLAFGAAPAQPAPMLNLSPRGDLIEAAANLFSHLRALDASGARQSR